MAAINSRGTALEYIIFIHKNADNAISQQQWSGFIEDAINSGMFRGGSEIDNLLQLGPKPVDAITKSIGGFMRFDADNQEALLKLLEKHPVLTSGGTIELCEMPTS